jgi:hypothetical protein
MILIIYLCCVVLCADSALFESQLFEELENSLTVASSSDHSFVTASMRMNGITKRKQRRRLRVPTEEESEEKEKEKEEEEYESNWMMADSHYHKQSQESDEAPPTNIFSSVDNSDDRNIDDSSRRLNLHQYRSNSTLSVHFFNPLTTYTSCVRRAAYFDSVHARVNSLNRSALSRIEDRLRPFGYSLRRDKHYPYRCEKSVFADWQLEPVVV